VIAGLAIVLILAVGFTTAVGRAIRRRQRDELRSIGHYHERLDMLHVESHDRGGAVRVVDAVDAPIASHREPGKPRLTPHVAKLGTPPEVDTVAPRERQVRQWALGRTQPRARVDTASMLIVASVVVVLVALGVVGYVLGHDRTASSGVNTTPSRSHQRFSHHHSSSGNVADIVVSTANAARSGIAVRIVATSLPAAVRVSPAT
jgi:hypothetical protein